MLRAIEMKLYLTLTQETTLTSWLRTSCWLYNRCLEQRIKAHKRRGESLTYTRQCALLTELRERMPSLRTVPVEFERDALRRVDRGMQAFFRRCKAGEKPGFPRFRSHTRYHSLECLAPGCYVRPGDLLSIPKLGLVRFRAGDQRIPRKQKLLRILRRASGWFAQVLVEDGLQPLPKVKVESAVGIDMGLESFATLDNGEKIDNPRFLRVCERRRNHAQRRLSRKQKGSRNRCKAIRRVARLHERLAAQRKSFAHQESRKLINRFDLIGFENLNIASLGKSRLAKSILDAAWGLFLCFLTYKAEGAGKWAIAVDPRGTSQECPQCGKVKPKNLSERIHRCTNGCPVLDRDQASAQVIHARALGVAGVVHACGGSDHYGGKAIAASRPVETGSLDGATHH